MGLDIIYYSKIKEINPKDESDCEIKTFNDNFEYQLGSLKNNQCYESTKESDYGSFRAGSYSSYNQWRNQLAIMAGYPSSEYVWNKFNKEIRKIKLGKINSSKTKMKPFFELINFPDCEGVIGQEISKKLHQDFVDFNDKAKNWDVNMPYFYDTYKEFEKAFLVASDSGAVYFC